MEFYKSISGCMENLTGENCAKQSPSRDNGWYIKEAIGEIGKNVIHN